MSKAVWWSKKPSKKLPHRKAELEKPFPSATVEVWSFDEHRLGLKPIIRKVWARVGERPIAEVNHRYEWTYTKSV